MNYDPVVVQPVAGRYIDWAMLTEEGSLVVGEICGQSESVFRICKFIFVGFYYLFNNDTCFGHTTIFKKHIFS
jgi:hypothetical protein